MSPLSSCWRTRSENEGSGTELADALSKVATAAQSPSPFPYDASLSSAVFGA